MREFSQLAKGWQTGLRRYADAPVNSGGLKELRNAKCTDRGIRDWESPSAAFSASELIAASVTYAPPFPQMFKGEKHVFLATQTKLYVVDTASWTLNRILTYDGYDANLQANIVSDGVWDFLDFGDSYMFFNGTSWVYKGGHATMVGETEKTYLVNTPAIQSACKFHGRAVYGGFSGTVWNSAWEASLRSLLKTDTGLAARFDDIGSNYVWWTGVAAGDMFWLIYPQLAFTGTLNANYEESIPYYVQNMWRGDSDFMPMTFKGAVVRMVPLGDNIIVFGEDGVTVMVYAKEETTFAKYKAEVPTIYQRGAVGASQDALIYVDKSGQLWHWDAKGSELLGYQEYMLPLCQSGNVNIFYDEVESDFIITGPSKSYILNKQGLSEVGRVLTGYVHGYTPARVATFVETGVGGAEDVEMLLTSHVLDAGTRACKTVMHIEVGLSSGSLTDITVALDFRYTHAATFTRTSFVPLNDEGFAQVPVNCLEFRWVVKSANYKTTIVDYVRYSVQFDDARTNYGLSENVDQNAA